MDKICQYSTIIFAGNMSALLFVSIMTDYWEYRGFDINGIKKQIPKKNRTKAYSPRDTNTYFLIHHKWEDSLRTDGLRSAVYYQPPALLTKDYYMRNVSKVRVGFNGTDNVTEVMWRSELMQYQDTVVLFVEYGNLYRNCDDLEVGVRDRLGIVKNAPNRCFNFIANVQERDFIQRELPAVIHLERAAFTFGVVCLISSVVSLVTGAYGSLARDRDTIVGASCSALISAMALIVTIALFHGKCHLLHRREFMKDIPVAYKKLIQDHRTQDYGWSFVLAWICVVLCFVHTWVWLLKAQNIPEKYVIRRARIARDRAFISYSIENNAMIED